MPDEPDEKQTDGDKKKADKRKRAANVAWIPIGIGVGVAVGVAIDNVGLGIAIGVAVGAALTAGMASKNRK